jgi:hypothetical protein
MLLQAVLKKLSDNGSYFLPLDGEGKVGVILDFLFAPPSRSSPVEGEEV